MLIVPTINGDGRAANTRGNLNGQDLNRDYSLIREPETFAFVEMLRDYKPWRRPSTATSSGTTRPVTCPCSCRGT